MGLPCQSYQLHSALVSEVVSLFYYQIVINMIRYYLFTKFENVLFYFIQLEFVFKSEYQMDLVTIQDSSLSILKILSDRI